MAKPDTVQTLEQVTSDIQKQAEAYRALARHLAGAAEAFKQLHLLAAEALKTKPE